MKYIEEEHLLLSVYIYTYRIFTHISLIYFNYFWDKLTVLIKEELDGHGREFQFRAFNAFVSTPSVLSSNAFKRLSTRHVC